MKLEINNELTNKRKKQPFRELEEKKTKSLECNKIEIKKQKIRLDEPEQK